MAHQRFIPVYQKLFDQYKDAIIRHKYHPGDQIDSINRIINKHKVSRETAKLVLHMLADQGLVIKIPGKGSFISGYAETNRKWGMILPLQTSNMEQLISALHHEAITRGRELEYFFHYNNPDEEMRLVGSMIREGYDAMIIVPNFNEEQTAGFYRKMIPMMRNLILIDFTMAGSYFNYVVQSYDLGVQRAIDHFLSNTDGNLLLVKNDLWKGRNLLIDLIEYTFIHAVEERAEKRNALVVDSHRDLSVEFIHNHRISGILCCYDTDALKVYSKLKSWKIAIPGQVSIINYGKTELLDLFDPGISFIDCLYNDMAGKAAEIIESGIKHGSFEQFVISPQLFIRDT